MGGGTYNKGGDTGDEIAIFYTEKLVFKVMLRGFFTSEASLKRHNMTLKSSISSLEWYFSSLFTQRLSKTPRLPYFTDIWIFQPNFSKIV